MGDADEPVSPCGLCRQSMMEFGEDILVIMANTRGEAVTATLRNLLPQAFTGRCIKQT
jgi:cytidine deaminase